MQFRLTTQKTPQLTQAQLGITREKKLNNIAYWKRQEDEYVYFLSYFMIAEKHKKIVEVVISQDRKYFRPAIGVRS